MPRLSDLAEAGAEPIKHVVVRDDYIVFTKDSTLIRPEDRPKYVFADGDRDDEHMHTLFAAACIAGEFTTRSGKLYARELRQMVTYAINRSDTRHEDVRFDWLHALCNAFEQHELRPFNVYGIGPKGLRQFLRRCT
jgi:hypothetical protein